MTLINEINNFYTKEFDRHDPVRQRRDFEREIARNNVRIRGTLFPVFLKPYFLDEQDRKRIEDVTAKIMRMLEKITAAFYGNVELAQALDIRGRVNSYLSVDHGFQHSIVVARLDSLFDRAAQTLKLIEFNCDDPSSFADNDVLNGIFQSNDTVRALNEKYLLDNDPLLERFKDAMFATYAEFCEKRAKPIQKTPTVVVSCSPNSSVKTDIDHLVSYLKDTGVNVRYADPRDLVYTGGKLHAGRDEIDILYRDNKGDIFRDESTGGIQKKLRNYLLRNTRKACSHNRFLNTVLRRSYFGHAEDILQAYKDGALCLINPFSAIITSQKSSLAVLHDPRFRNILTDEELRVVDAHIPWTAFVSDRQVAFNGKALQLVPFIKDHKDLFVLKPIAGYGGRGVLIGKDQSRRAWECAVDRALVRGNEHVVQEFVPIPQEEFPDFQDDRYAGFKKKNINVNFWAFNGAFVGAYVRISHKSVINISQGGGLAPVYYVKGRK